MAEIKSKVEKLKLENGETVSLTLNFARLLYLRSKGYEKDVERAMKIVSNKNVSLLDTPELFYTAYLCANEEPKYSRNEFIELVPFDLGNVANIFMSLIGAEKKTPHSKKPFPAVNKKAK